MQGAKWFGSAENNKKPETRNQKQREISQRLFSRKSNLPGFVVGFAAVGAVFGVPGVAVLGDVVKDVPGD